MKGWIKLSLLYASLFLAFFVEAFAEDSPLHPKAERNCFLYFLAGAFALFAAVGIASFLNKDLRAKLVFKSPFFAGVFLFLNVLNVLSAKLALLPVLYFPTLDRVLGVFVEDGAFLAKCVLYSFRIQIFGTAFGAAAGIATGIALGFSKRASYWLSPVIRILGPIPSTAWIPVVLIVFPSARSASTFLIALSVWFPTAVLTNSGISNVRNAFFEVSDTLGAGRLYKAFRVGVPAAMPQIFQGLFNGTCASFIALMTAEMIGAKYGIGWYVNWQKDMMCYANVYAGLVVIAVLFSLIVTALFKIRDKVLVWQKGVIKW